MCVCVGYYQIDVADVADDDDDDALGNDVNDNIENATSTMRGDDDPLSLTCD